MKQAKNNDVNKKADVKKHAVVNKQTLLTTADLKGKKVDGDPSLESDQPIDQLHPEKSAK